MSYEPPNPNPYASPSFPSEPPAGPFLPPHVIAKAEAIIKDAGQFWLAILMCIVCTALGSIIIGPWYFARLMQWNSLAREYPTLMQRAYPGTLPHRFQGAKIKLIIGMCFGIVILGLVFLVVVVNVALS